jgi:hypothetical protein
MMVTILAAAVSIGMVSLDSSSACPSASAVRQQLAPLLAGNSREPVRVHIDADGERLHLEIWHEGASTPLDRTIEGAPADCDARARLAAVVIAGWRVSVTDGDAAVVSSADAPRSQPRSEPPNTGTPALAVARTLPQRRRIALAVDAAFVASFSRDSFAPGAAVDVVIGPDRSRWSAQLGLRGFANRNDETSLQQISGTRIPLVVGGAYRFGGAGWGLAPHADAAVALVRTHTEGSGTSTVFDYDFGLGAGLHASLRLGRLRPFVDLGVMYWLRRQDDVDPLVARGAVLPNLEILASMGAALALTGQR